ncbi:MAG TPA: hypothetical protein VN752_03105 [Solirubrobacterales bacterium]|nr:hypothetical protein [Solirubrobacterales bacterium]
MRSLRIAAFVALLATAVALVPSARAALVGIYRNGMESKGQLAQVTKLSGKRCARGATDHAFLITIGKQTRECAYRTPVFGRDLEIAATERLLDKTPKSVQQAAFLAVELRSGSGARYQLAVYPVQRKAQLRKITEEGSIEYLHIEKDVAGIGAVDRANQLRLRAFNVTEGPEKGSCRILAFVGGELVADVVDVAAGELSGRASGFSVGSPRTAKGAQASVDDVVVRVPSPF